MKTVSQAIPRKAKTLDNAGKHKCILLYKKVGWPVGHKMLKANHKSRSGEQNFNEVFHIIDRTEEAECCFMWLKDFLEKILALTFRKKNAKQNGVKVD